MNDDARQRGLTLIEMITVVLLLGIIAVFVAPRLDLSTYSQRGFHDALKSTLQFARQTAIAKRRQVCVDLSGNALSLTIAASAPESGVLACPTATPLALPAPDSGCAGSNQLCAPSGVTLGGIAFRFDAQGRASVGATFSATGQPDVTVVQETGYVY